MNRLPFLLAIILASASFDILACRCRHLSDKYHFNKASAVWIAKANEIKLHGNAWLVDLEILENRKGPYSGKVRISTPQPDGACGYPFKTGHVYLLYIQGDKQLYTTICEPNKDQTTQPQR